MASALGAMVALLLAVTTLPACQATVGSGDTTPTAADAASVTQAQTTVAESTSTAAPSSSTTAAPGSSVTLNPQPTHTRPTAGPTTTKTTEPPPSPATPVPPGKTTTSFILTPITGDTIPTTWTRYEETDPHIQWTGSWASYPSPAASGGSFRAASSKAEASLMFRGTALRLVAVVSPEGGMAQVDVIDKATGTIYTSITDFYWPIVTTRNVFNTAPMPLGDYLVSITWTGSVNGASVGTAVNVDAIEVMGRLVAP